MGPKRDFGDVVQDILWCLVLWWVLLLYGRMVRTIGVVQKQLQAIWLCARYTKSFCSSTCPHSSSWWSKQTCNDRLFRYCTQPLGRITCVLVLISKSSMRIVATPAPMQDKRSIKQSMRILYLSLGENWHSVKHSGGISLSLKLLLCLTSTSWSGCETLFKIFLSLIIIFLSFTTIIESHSFPTTLLTFRISLLSLLSSATLSLLPQHRIVQRIALATTDP